MEDNTTVSISISVHQYLKSKKVHPKESFDDVLSRLLKLNGGRQ